MCNRVNESTYVAEGWACCHCTERLSHFYGAPAESSRWIYNGLVRLACKGCGAPRCSTLQPDPHPRDERDEPPIDDRLARLLKMGRDGFGS